MFKNIFNVFLSRLCLVQNQMKRGGFEAEKSVNRFLAWNTFQLVVRTFIMSNDVNDELTNFFSSMSIKYKGDTNDAARPTI